jgi:hypothetical protein
MYTFPPATTALGTTLRHLSALLLLLLLLLLLAMVRPVQEASCTC